MEELVLSKYPNALSGEHAAIKCKDYAVDTCGSVLNKMLFATSVCSDDINVSADFTPFFTRSFMLGGLGGLPYAGVTGMEAFSQHIPDGGDAFIFYGPHIGITDDGELGKMRRPGQRELTDSCGSLMLALNRMQQTEEIYVPYMKTHDYQQTLLENTLMPFKQAITRASDPKKEITEKAYLEIDKQIHYLVRRSKAMFEGKRVFLLGGIIINTSPGYHDYLDVRDFRVFDTMNLQEGKPEALLINYFKDPG